MSNLLAGCVMMVASFYGGGDGLCGGKTASGEKFNCAAHTAAHKTLHFGTKLRVERNGRSVVVRINDRGPFIKGRSLDLSQGAAAAIGLTAVGVGTVKVCRE